MDLQSITTTLRDYIITHYSISTNDPDFSDDVHLFDYGYIDSFGAVDLVNFVQQRFEINVSQADMIAYPLNTINEIAQFAVLRKQGEL
jgi:acyl carrier protein